MGSNSSEHWSAVLEHHWGVVTKLSQVDGECGLNLISTDVNGYVLKITGDGCNAALVDMQCRALDLLRESSNLPVPQVLPALSGACHVSALDEKGVERTAWLMNRLTGTAYALWRPHTAALAYQVGRAAGIIDRVLAGFEHPMLNRSLKWRLADAMWIKGKYEKLFDEQRRHILDSVVAQFQSVADVLAELPTSAIHNDLNDWNILVSGSFEHEASVTGLIDLGDMCRAARIEELAVAGAYVVLGGADWESRLSSLARGYHEAWPLTVPELDILWPLLRMRLAVSVVNSALMSLEKPDDPYVTISQEPAWKFLESSEADEIVRQGVLIRMRLRAACGFPVADDCAGVVSWLDSMRGRFAQVICADLATAPMRSLSVQESAVPADPLSLSTQEAAELGRLSGEDGQVWMGYYGEPRLVYTEAAFGKSGHGLDSRRTVHLGVDVFAPSGTKVHTPLGATVFYAGERSTYLDYGGVVILRHHTGNGSPFFTLYGHLDPSSLAGLQAGRELAAGEHFASLGDISTNGGWNPHLHFQLALSTAAFGSDWPGVADPDELGLLQQLFPNPAALLNLSDDKIAFQVVERAVVERERSELFPANLKLSYNQPAMFLRGWKHYLFDEWGRRYLDCYNNVPHVGHSHPRIQRVAAEQLKRLNSNTRYLHPAPAELAKKLRSKLPESLSVCCFVNSGSEANELALRMARAHTGGMDMITPDHGYHGNTTGAMSISAYKFNAPGGHGKPDWVQLVEVADDYRGSFRRDDPDRAHKYALQVDDAIGRIHARGGKLAGFIAETFPSVGGQIIPPAGYLVRVYESVRKAGGVCIADEVQTALGRLGEYFFAFEQQRVTPDIVVLGKPIGNGYPLGVVITTEEIAASFASGPEFFSTFGGSTLPCLIGREVLEIVDDEGLMRNALEVGNHLLLRLRELQASHEIMGDVRGHGLFIGVDLVENTGSRQPATAAAQYVKNRLHERRVLIGTEGPCDNVLKVRPPLSFDRESADLFVEILAEVLLEAEVRRL